MSDVSLQPVSSESQQVTAPTLLKRRRLPTFAVKCFIMTNYVKWIFELIVICIQLEAIQTQISTANPSITSMSRRCKAPPQPENGHWQLHRLQCSNGENCDVPEETELELGSVLIYSCNSGYKLNGSSDVSCIIEGKWLNIPVCSEIRCKPLSTASTEARCIYNDEWVSCESSVLPGTKALLSCQNSYQRDITLFSRDEVRCNSNGQWKPQPIRCVPVCGTLPGDVVPLIYGGVAPNITEFPWHASMYQEQPDKSKKYICGATIIQESLLITAAHCIHDEITKRVVDANKIHIVTGNVFRDYGSTLHDQRLVKKNKVKKIHIICNYIGYVGNYAWDIAILELVTPFVLSNSLVPACLNPFSDAIVLEPGVYGKVAGFGRTAIGESSAVLQALTVPYISYNECESASQNSNTKQFITMDKFCAGYLNGSSVCDGDSGGGLVVKTNDLWYLRGIVSVSLGTIYREGTTRCDNNLYTLYTRVFSHIGWIQDVIETLQQNRSYPSCPNKTWCKPLITSSTIESTDARCIYNDKWISCESPVLPGTTASLSCQISYRRETTLLSSDEIRCNTNGQWEPEPIQCTSELLQNCSRTSVTWIYRNNVQQQACPRQLIFEDNFDSLENSKWNSEKRFAGPPDYEFVVYMTNEVTDVSDGRLRIRPIVTDDKFGADFVSHGKLALENCTSKNTEEYFCQRQAVGWYILPPVISGRINTKKKFEFLFGRIEIKAKLPHGDWVYPVIILESSENTWELGMHEIRIASSVGNEYLTTSDGDNISGRMLCAGGLFFRANESDVRSNNRQALSKRRSNAPWSNDYHVFEIEWKSGLIIVKVDRVKYGEQVVDESFGKPSYLTLGVAVGGFHEFEDHAVSNGYVKPWRDFEMKAMYKFYRTKDKWYPTWNAQTALLVDYVKVWAL